MTALAIFNYTKTIKIARAVWLVSSVNVVIIFIAVSVYAL